MHTFGATSADFGVVAVADRKHAATSIAVRFKEERLRWYRTLLERMRVADPRGLAMQLQILVEGAIASALVRDDPSFARSARAAAEVLLEVATRKSKK